MGKESDYGHLKKNVNKKFEEIAAKHKQMTQKVVDHFRHCFANAVM